MNKNIIQTQVNPHLRVVKATRLTRREKNCPKIKAKIKAVALVNWFRVYCGSQMKEQKDICSY